MHADLPCSFAQKIRKQFCGCIRLLLVNDHEGKLRLTEPCNPNPKARLDSFSGSLPDEYPIENRVINLRHAKSVIETERRKDNDDRLKEYHGGIAAQISAKQLKETYAVLHTRH